MKVVVKKLEDLRRPERNTRMHTDKQLVEFRRSIEMFGQIRPIVVDEGNVILAGNGLYDALLSMGRTEADCYVVSGLSEREKKKLMLADNRIFDLGVDDMTAFDAVIAELSDDLDIPGYDEDLLRSLVAEADEVTDMMSAYGILPDDKREGIRDAKVHEQNAAPAPSDQNQSTDAREAAEAGRYINCPKCGERIWL